MAPESFGQYKAVREIGRGGMSVVYEGARSDGGFDRRVAIKLLLQQSPGAFSEGETRILALLEHPGIARFLDAGVAPSGLHYLVMEYVDGEPCTEYCRRLGLGEAARLRLFLQICAAVQYANRSLVIHCDLKPGNILVTKDGAVKLMDFGVAKALAGGPGGGQTTGATRPFTPDYASPEQILGERLTFATDVYSLGVLLCELAGGALPRTLSTLSVEEAVQTARTEVERAPLAGDLEQIARKALRADPSQRYESASALAQDVERYLDGRAIEARPPSRLYRARMFARRNRLAVAATGLTAAALAIAAGTALWQARLAARRFDQVRTLSRSVLFEMHDAIEKLPGSMTARHLLVDRSVEYLDALAKDAGGDESLQLEVARGYTRLADIEGVGNEPSLGKSGSAFPRLDRANEIVRRVLARNPGSAEARAVLFLVLDGLATGYSLRGDERAIEAAREMLAVAQGDPVNVARALAVQANVLTQSKTRAPEGLAAWQRAVDAWKKLYDGDPKPVLHLRELARAHQYSAGALLRARQPEPARQQAMEAYRMHKELAAIPGEVVGHMIAADVGILANLNAQLGRFQEALPLFEEQLRIRQEVAARDPGNMNAALGVAATINRLGWARVKMGRTAEALPFLEEALAKQRLVYAKDPGNVLVNREMLYALADVAMADETLKRTGRICGLVIEAAAIMKGPIANTRETTADAAKKAFVRSKLPGCGGAL